MIFVFLLDFFLCCKGDEDSDTRLGCLQFEIVLEKCYNFPFTRLIRHYGNKVCAFFFILESSLLFNVVISLLHEFKKMFHTLDKDKDGLLNKLNIEIKALPSNIQKVLDPIIIEIQRDNLTLNEEDFTKACLKLYDNLEFIERRKLLDYARSDNIKNKKYDNLNNFTFKPKINKFYYTNLMKHSPEKGKETRMKNNYFQGSFSNQQHNVQHGGGVKYCSDLTENSYGNQKGIENEERLNPVETGNEQENNNEINDEK